MAKRVVDVLVPVALDRAYSYRVPEALELAPGDIVCVPLGAREATAVVWAENPTPNPRLDNRLKDVEEKLDLPPLARRAAQTSSTGSRTTRSRRAAWCCACACAWASNSAPSASASACALPAPPPQRMTARARARARAPRRRHGARQERCGARSRRQRRRDRRPHRRRHARNGGAAAGAGRGKTRSRFCAAGFHAPTRAPPPRR